MVAANLYAALGNAYGGALSLLCGTRVTVDATAPLLPNGVLSALPALATGRLAQLSVSAEGAGGLIPFSSASLSGHGVQLGWKIPALLLIPGWTLLAPALLPLLLALWLALPSGPTSGSLSFDVLLRSVDLNRRRANVWRWLLGLVLNGIAASSLPGLLSSASLAAGPSGSPAAAALQIPASECLSAAVEGGKLVLEGRARFAGAEPGAPLSVADYTLRMGVAPQRANARDGVVRADGRLLVRSALLWENPEIKLSLGDTGFAKFLPKLWMPVMAATAVELPRSVDLMRASASDAADGLVFQGAIHLYPSAAGADGNDGSGEPGRWGDDDGGSSGGGGGGDRRAYTDAERAALRLPPSQ